MRIVFADMTTLDFNVETPHVAPLGGSQSAACYLAQALAALGEDVAFISRTTSPGTFRGVQCLTWGSNPGSTLKASRPDRLIGLLSAGFARAREALPSVPFILWTQHADDQPSVARLREPQIRNAFDAIVLASQWQRERYVQSLQVDPARTAVIGNGVSPAFENLFAAGQPILSHKQWPPTLVYTSTPFRGLDLLLNLFPHIRRRVPGTTLEVFSSMGVYQMSARDESYSFGPLYEHCRRTEGVEYVGSVPQPRLAERLRSASCLSYPNTFKETFCIAALEAMAAGCRVVSTRHGALPETTAGFATLISPDPPEDYGRRFVEAVCAVLEQSPPASPARADAEAHLSRQLQYTREQGTWNAKALQWMEFLHAL